MFSPNFSVPMLLEKNNAVMLKLKFIRQVKILDAFTYFWHIHIKCLTVFHFSFSEEKDLASGYFGAFGKNQWNLFRIRL